MALIGFVERTIGGWARHSRRLPAYFIGSVLP